VTEATLTQVLAPPCPPPLPHRPPDGPSIVIECLQAAANGSYSGSPSTTVVGGLTLSRDGGSTWLHGHGWEAVVYVAGNLGPHGLGQAMLATVQPTGRSC
jgi:hypothetical protein